MFDPGDEVYYTIYLTPILAQEYLVPLKRVVFKLEFLFVCLQHF